MVNRLKVAVIGEGHLADATRTCVREHFDNVGPISESDLVWFCVDTPVDEHDVPDVKYVHDGLAAWIINVLPGTPILISSQLPVGTCANWEKEWPDHCLIVQPENIRKLHAASDFHTQSRMIVGERTPDLYRTGETKTEAETQRRLNEHRSVVNRVLERFTPNIFWMTPESAEMVKHTLNTFLAMEIAFSNEIADICGLVGADVADVFRGFKSDRRVSFGKHAPLNPGAPYTGGTLGRDVHVLRTIAGTRWQIIDAIAQSNMERLCE